MIIKVNFVQSHLDEQMKDDLKPLYKEMADTTREFLAATDCKTKNALYTKREYLEGIISEKQDTRKQLLALRA